MQGTSDLLKMKLTPLSFSMKTELKKFHRADHKKINPRQTLMYLFHPFLFMQHKKNISSKFFCVSFICIMSQRKIFLKLNSRAKKLVI